MNKPALATLDLAGDALKSLADGVTLVDGDGRVVFLNPRTQTMFGLTTERWLGRNASDYFHALAQNALSGEGLAERLQEYSAQAEQMPSLEFVLRAPNERIIEAKWFAVHGASSDGHAYGVLWRDMTREKELDQMKTQLLSTVSHELRTPLASIKGFATTLLRQDVRWDEATQREFLRIIEEESNRLEELIDNLLEMSQLETGALSVRKEPVQLRHLVREAVEHAQRRTETHWFVMDLPAELPRVWADPRRIRQVLNNLLDNAIKYSPEGGQITVTCEVENDFVVVSVADQGVGIPREYVDRIFDRFFQVDGASTRKIGGSGLGLAIAKGIMEAHHGKIWAEEGAGQGSIFRFSLPVVKDADLRQNSDTVALEE